MERRNLLKLFALTGGSLAFGLGQNYLSSAIASEGGSSWGHVGEGAPENWGELSSTYTACRAGLQQSPVDLNHATSADLASVEINYSSIPLTVLNNGHTIQVNVAGGNSIKLDGEPFELIQFHFHHPSEHINIFPLNARTV